MTKPNAKMPPLLKIDPGRLRLVLQVIAHAVDATGVTDPKWLQSMYRRIDGAFPEEKPEREPPTDGGQ